MYLATKHCSFNLKAWKINISDLRKVGSLLCEKKGGLIGLGIWRTGMVR